jgi:lipoyl(octanoyl) transferase 2
VVAALLASKPPSAQPLPPPTVLTAQFHPIYTTGRRDLPSPSAEQVALLRATGADFFPASRGGLTTFHGPGQLVAYPILDLREHFPGRGIGAREYVALLERTVQATLSRYGVASVTLCDAPGVWVTPERKICAVGIHMRRHITSHGIALNVDTDLSWFEHIMACGLEGKETTSLKREGVAVEGGVEEAGRIFVGELAGAMHAEGVKEIGVDDIPVAEEGAR